jgi:hypothetical protein
MVQLLGGVYAMTMLAPLAMMLFGAVPVLIYLVARWRHPREYPTPDPQLGLKTALHLFRVAGFQLALGGAFALLWGALTREQSEPALRLGASLLLPGGLIWLVHRALCARTNSETYPNIERMFDGWNLVWTGLIGMLALTLLFVVLLREGESGEAGRAAFALCLAYVGAWVGLGFVWLRRSGLLPPAAPPGGASVPPQPPGHPPQPGWGGSGAPHS